LPAAHPLYQAGDLPVRRRRRADHVLGVLELKRFEMHRVVITGMGWVTPMGHSIDAVWKRLLAGESGIAKTTIFDAATFPTTFSAEVKDYDLHADVPDTIRHETAGRNTRFALGACAQAWKMASLPPFQSGLRTQDSGLDLDRVGIYLGSGEGSLDFDAYTTAALSAW